MQKVHRKFKMNQWQKCIWTDSQLKKMIKLRSMLKITQIAIECSLNQESASQQMKWGFKYSEERVIISWEIISKTIQWFKKCSFQWNDFFEKSRADVPEAESKASEHNFKFSRSICYRNTYFIEE